MLFFTFTFSINFSTKIRVVSNHFFGIFLSVFIQLPLPLKCILRASCVLCMGKTVLSKTWSLCFRGGKMMARGRESHTQKRLQNQN